MQKYLVLFVISIGFQVAVAQLPEPVFYNDFNDSTHNGKFGNGHFYSGYSGNTIPHSIEAGNDWSISLWCNLDSANHKNGITIFTTTSLLGFDRAKRQGHDGIKLGVNRNLDNTYSLGFTEYNIKDYDHNTGGVVHDQWFHLVLAYSGDSLKVYIDGELNTTYHTTQPMDITELYYGQPSDHQADIGTYYMDELRLYDELLSEASVMELYNYSPIQLPTTDATEPPEDVLSTKNSHLSQSVQRFIHKGNIHIVKNNTVRILDLRGNLIRTYQKQ